MSLIILFIYSLALVGSNCFNDLIFYEVFHSNSLLILFFIFSLHSIFSSFNDALKIKQFSSPFFLLFYPLSLSFPFRSVYL